MQIINVAVLMLRMQPVRPQDNPFIFDLFCSVRAPELDYTPMDATQKKQFLITQFNAMHSSYAERYPNGKHKLIVVDGQQIGRLYTIESTDELRILDIIIHPDRRNDGIGSQIMSRLIQRSDKTNKPLRFYVWQTNSGAQRFYARHGCHVVRQDGAYILMERLPHASAAT